MVERLFLLDTEPPPIKRFNRSSKSGLGMSLICSQSQLLHLVAALYVEVIFGFWLNLLHMYQLMHFLSHSGNYRPVQGYAELAHACGEGHALAGTIG
jgi:hypothetical protein